MSSRASKRYADRKRSMDKRARAFPPGRDRRPTFTDDERAAAEAAFDELLARQRENRQDEN